MHPTLSHYLARALLRLHRRQPLITATLCVLAVGALAPRASAEAAVRAASAGAVAFVPIVEPFDPGHPARTEPNPGNCYAQQNTVGIEQCFDTETENTDARIDAAQLARFRRSTAAAQVAINTRAPKAALPQTDSIDLSQLAYYTPPGGTRIAEIDTQHPGQGWTLLCNGALVFDDRGALLPGGRVAAISDAPRTRLCSATRTGERTHA